MTVQSWTIFITTVFIASIIPGPGMLLALTHGIKYGTKVTIFSALGNILATIIQACISIAGLGIILTASGIAFTTIKWIGAIYLVYLGIRSWLNKKNSFDIKNSDDSSKKIHPIKVFSEAFVLTLGNPKAILFFTALFPQFINANSLALLNIFSLLCVLSAIAFICWMLYAFCGKKIVSFLNNSFLGKHFNRVIGGTFIGFGLAMAVTDR